MPLIACFLLSWPVSNPETSVPTRLGLVACQTTADAALQEKLEKLCPGPKCCIQCQQEQQAEGLPCGSTGRKKIPLICPVRQRTNSIGNRAMGTMCRWRTRHVKSRLSPDVGTGRDQQSSSHLLAWHSISSARFLTFSRSRVRSLKVLGQIHALGRGRLQRVRIPTVASES